MDYEGISCIILSSATALFILVIAYRFLKG